MGSQFLFLPNYYKCKRILKKLLFFKDLVAHEIGRGVYVTNAKPLSQLLPEVEGKGYPDVQYILKREINRLIPYMREVFLLAQIETQINFSNAEYEFDRKDMKDIKKEKKAEYDLLNDYFEMPKSGGASGMIVDSLDRAIGWYLHDKEVAFWEMFNPICWCAYFLKLPLIILERAGISSSNKILSDIYSWLIKILMLLAIGLGAAKLGISIPWNNIVGMVK